MIMIPYSIMNEHRDAYYHWCCMIEKGYIPAEGNYLLHIDHHDDMTPGGYAWDLTEMPKNAEEALRFTDECLGIADFIVPAIWQGIFSTCHIFKNLIPAPVKSTDMVMRLANSQVLLPQAYIPFIHSRARAEGDPKLRFYTYKENGLDKNADFSDVKNLVLDVDLDYFCWDDSLKSVPQKRMEITKEAYEEYMSDRDHPFRIMPKRYLYAMEEDGRYWLVFEENTEREPLPSEEMIEKRVDRLFRWLKKTKVTPAAIDICRSSVSGYLPAGRAEFVEKTFIEKLHEAYDVKEELF